MFYEKITKHKTQLNTAKYKDEIKKIINAMLKEEKTFEHYDFFKEDYDVFIHSILGKLIAINTIPIMIDIGEPLSIDKKIFIQKHKKSVIEMMIHKHAPQTDGCMKQFESVQNIENIENMENVKDAENLKSEIPNKKIKKIKKIK
jgi:hypothetical protein